MDRSPEKAGSVFCICLSNLITVQGAETRDIFVEMSSTD